MKFTLPLFLVIAFAVTGCAAPERRSTEPDVSLDQAKEMIRSGRVAEIFQPHQGCVVMMLGNGELVTFQQPRLDWIVDYVEDQGLSDAIPVSME